MNPRQLCRALGAVVAASQLATAADILKIDFENSIDPGGGVPVITQEGWSALVVANVPTPAISVVSDTFDGIGVTLTANGAGFFQGRAANTWNEMTGTSWNNMVEDLIAARGGDGTVTITFSGLTDATEYTLTVWHNASATDSASFAGGFYTITPSMVVGALVGVATNGQATNLDRNDAATDDDFLNSVISFSSTGGSAEILLTSASANAFLAMSGIRLTAFLDADADGLDDLWEDLHFGDNDGAATPAELAFQSGTDDGYPVPDVDGLDNLAEQAAGTDPNDPDTDADGLNDGDELSGAQNPFKVDHIPGDPPGGTPGEPTDPLLADSDGDELLDGEEVFPGLDNFVSNPNDSDTDFDFLPDGWESANGLDPAVATGEDGEFGDPDLDNLNNGNEFLVGTNPRNPDTDADGYNDGAEDLFGSWADIDATGTDPLNPDTDGDGLLDGQENPDLAVSDPPNQYKTDPNFFDSDFDTYGDGAEIEAGSDPNDPNSIPGDDPSIVLQVDFENSIDPGGGVPVITQPRWTPIVVSNAPSPTVSVVTANIDGVDVTLTAGGAGGIFQGRAATSWNNMTGTSWNNMVEDVIAARSGDGTVAINFSGLNDGLQYTLTVWHNVSATDSASFASGLYAITPSVTTGTLVGTATNGQATNWTRNTVPLATDSDFLNSIISFSPSGGSAEILLTSASANGFLVLSGLELRTSTSSPGGELLLTAAAFDGAGNFEVTVTGLTPGTQYVLKRSANLQDGFPSTAFGPFTAASVTETHPDSLPPTGEAYYRVEEVP